MKYTKFLPVLALLLFSFIPLFDLLHAGLPVTHDGQDHVARIANFYQNLKEGIIIPRWAAHLNWGYGHPILMFLYPLPSYFSSLIHFIGFSFVDSLKIVFVLGFVTSGLIMYLWTKEFLNKRGALVAGLLYMFAPYRFVDLYVRGAIGEHVAFIFPPLIFYFLIKLSKNYSYWYVLGGSLSLGGLILSHNAITLMFMPLIFIYIFYLILQCSNKKYFILNTLYLILLGFGLSAFFWIPAFFEGKYTLRDIVTKGEYGSRFVNFKDFLYGQWSYGGAGQFSVQVGIIHWIVVVLSFPVSIFLFKKKNKLWITSVALGIIFLLTLILMTSYSKFVWEKITVLQKFQFPWRFLTLTVFVSSVLGGIVASVIPKNIRLAMLVIFFILLLYVNRGYWHAKEYRLFPETFFTNVYYGTTDTGESAPIWSVRFMEKRPKAPVEIIEGKGIIKQKIRQTTEHSYRINADSVVRVRENTLYFPGWLVLMDGKQVDLQFQDPDNRGLITFYVLKGSHTIDVKFKETRLRLLADIISLLSIVVLVIYCIMNKKRLWQLFR